MILQPSKVLMELINQNNEGHIDDYEGNYICKYCLFTCLLALLVHYYNINHGIEGTKKNCSQYILWISSIILVSG